MTRQPRLVPAGEGCVIAVIGEALDGALNARVHALDCAVRAAGWRGVRETIPAYAALGIVFDPLVLAPRELERRLAPLLDAAAEPPCAAERTVAIDVAYGGDDGPDLADVSRHTGLDPAEVVRRHAAGHYRCHMLGFIPGFPYLAGLDPALSCPRLDTPRTRVAAGSVAIAGPQAGIYPAASPGGWRVIGRTAAVLFDPARPEPALVRPGDAVRFVPGPPRPPAAPAVRAPAGDGVLGVRTPGLLTTVQDLGRPGWASLGVPAGGALDPFALRIANLLAGNPEGAAALELNGPGAVFECLAPALLALGGADCGATLDGRPLAPWSAAAAAPGAVLRFEGPRRRGGRAYLALAGGIDVPAVLGARATLPRAALGGFAGRPLAAGDVLPGRPGAGAAARDGLALPAALLAGFVPAGEPAGVVRGPEDDRFAAEALAALCDTLWIAASRSDRMGLRLDGPPLAHRGEPGLVSRPHLAGAIQVPGDGLPIVALADGPTTGGYARPATVARADLPRLAQLAPGDALRFEWITREAAVARLARQRARFARLAAWLARG